MNNSPSKFTLGLLSLLVLIGVPGGNYLLYRTVDNYINNKNAQREVIKIEQRDTNNDGLADLVMTYRDGKEKTYLAQQDKRTGTQLITYALSPQDK